MRNSARAMLGLGLLAGLATAWLHAGEQVRSSPPLAPWAPRWARGDWWELQLFKPDERLPLPERPPRGAPRIVLYDRAPAGFRPAGRLRFRVLGRVRSVGKRPKILRLVSVLSLAPLPQRRATLCFEEDSLRLVKLIPARRSSPALEFKSAALLKLDTSLLGLPLHWPDLRLKPIGSRGNYRQQLRRDRAGRRHRLRASRRSPSGGTTAWAETVWEPGLPFWRHFRSPTAQAALVAHGRGGSKSRKIVSKAKE